MDIKMNKKNRLKWGQQAPYPIPSGYVGQWGRKDIKGKTKRDII